MNRIFTALLFLFIFVQASFGQVRMYTFGGTRTISITNDVPTISQIVSDSLDAYFPVAYGNVAIEAIDSTNIGDGSLSGLDFADKKIPISKLWDSGGSGYKVLAGDGFGGVGMYTIDNLLLGNSCVTGSKIASYTIDSTDIGLQKASIQNLKYPASAGLLPIVNPTATGLIWGQITANSIGTDVIDGTTHIEDYSITASSIEVNEIHDYHLHSSVLSLLGDSARAGIESSYEVMTLYQQSTIAGNTTASSDTAAALAYIQPGDINGTEWRTKFFYTSRMDSIVVVVVFEDNTQITGSYISVQLDGVTLGSSVQVYDVSDTVVVKRALTGTPNTIRHLEIVSGALGLDDVHHIYIYGVYILRRFSQYF
jgi:hypothetical protein